MLGVGLALTSVGALGSRAFHPTDIDGLIALYDISDLSSLFEERTGASASTPASVDGVVGTVLDRSGNGRHLTAVSDAARPVLRSTGGLYYLQFDGIDDRFTASAPGDLASASLGAVSQQTGSANVDVIFGIENTTDKRFQFYCDSGRNVAGASAGGGFVRVDYAGSSAQSKTVSVQVWNGSALTSYTNGVQANTANVAGTIAVNGGVVYLGASPTFLSNIFQGAFYCGVIYSRDLNAAERTKVENWLAEIAGVAL